MAAMSNDRSDHEPSAHHGGDWRPPTGFLLSKAGRTQSVRFTEALEPLGLRPTQFALLNFVERGAGSSQQQLGERLGLDPSGLVAVIDDLEEKGLVERRRDPSDRRCYGIHLTRAGRKKLARAREVAMRRQAELLAPLTEQEAKTLHELLLRVVAAEDPHFRPMVTDRRSG
jgi:DNA-binding MarR family transcriptional regulator